MSVQPEVGFHVTGRAHAKVPAPPVPGAVMSETTSCPGPRRGRGAGGAVEGPEHPAQGGRPAGAGPGRLRRRHQAPQHGLRALRPLAVRARDDQVDRPLRRPRNARRLRSAHRRGGRGAHRSVLPALDAARERDQGLRPRRRPRPLRGRPGRHRRRRDAASWRATPPSSSRSTTSRSRRTPTPAARSTPTCRCSIPTPARTSSGRAPTSGAAGTTPSPRRTGS